MIILAYKECDLMSKVACSAQGGAKISHASELPCTVPHVGNKTLSSQLYLLSPQDLAQADCKDKFCSGSACC